MLNFKISGGRGNSGWGGGNPSVPPPLYETLIQGETEGGRWIQRETGEIEGDRGYRGIQYTNDMLTQHIS